MIILKMVLKQGLKVWTGFIWHRRRADRDVPYGV
jgi:hypothetical protein